MRVYIVSLRWGIDLIEPSVFKTRKEAERFAEEFILDGAREFYDGKSPNPTKRTLYNWAERNGYVLSNYYFWDGGSDAMEALVSEKEV